MSLWQQASWFLLSLLASDTSTSSKSSSEACRSITSILPGHVSFPLDHVYEDSISSYAFLGTRLRPTCIVTPTSTKDVATVINALTYFDSVAFAVRSGGHNTNKGFADVEDGITIDLSAMKELTLNHSANIISVGPGARWQSVYDLLDQYNISVQGGRNGHVGVGGYLLGGGISFFSPERGWACDSVVNFEVVTAPGEVINANATSNTDLFIALKGGLNNFGIVTRFDLETFEQGPMWGGVIIYPNSSDDALLDTLSAFKKPERFDPHAMLTFGFSYNTMTRTFSSDIAMYHSRPEKVGGTPLESFAKVEPQLFNSLRIGSPGSFAGEKLIPVVKQYYTQANEMATQLRVGNNYYSGIQDHSLRINASFKRNSLAITELYAYANVTMAYSIQSVPAAAPASNPNSLGFLPSSQPERELLNIGIALLYEDPAATVGLQAVTERITREIDQIATEDHTNDNHLYLNYAGGWQDVLGGYGNASLEYLRDVSTKYDSRGMFQKQVKGGFKLFQM